MRAQPASNIAPKSAEVILFSLMKRRTWMQMAVCALRAATQIVAMLVLCAVLRGQQWPAYGNDPGGSKYSTLSQINRSNVSGLKVAWEWKTGEVPNDQYKTFPGNFQATPLMIDGVLYFSTPYNRVIALDAETGHELWSYDPKAYEDGQPPNGTGFVHRGVAAWREGGKLRIFMNSRYRLICLDAATGTPITSFGDNGIINLTQGLLWETNPKHYTNTSPPVVYKDLVIVGNGVGDRLVYKNDPPGDVRAWNAHTGKLAWSFHTIPQKGEFGNDTWENGSEKITGHTNVWAPFTVDAERGLVYLPVTTPSNDFYGGRRPGANLFAESLVCLDANTGKRKWHYQLVHHGLWDYDLPSPPNLVTITVGGRKIDAVVQLTKMGFVYGFDRVTGKPVWPIEERAVPASDVPGEHAWPTQPFPTKPPPLTAQGVTLDDAFDLTPELKKEAQEAMKKYRMGPLFTPPSLQGTLMLPGNIGGANWGGGAFDPETAMLYVKTSNNVTISQVAKPESPEVDADYAMARGGNATFHNGLPLLKPPYGHLSAVNLNTGEIAWHEPFGDMPRLRSHPALEGVKLPEKFGVAGAQGVIVTKGGIVFAGGGDTAFHAVDKSNGRDLWSYPLGRQATATPMTYQTKSGRQFVVIATGSGREAAVLVAFALE
jgi:quinoprotein glucose dehydrogenase